VRGEWIRVEESGDMKVRGPWSGGERRHDIDFKRFYNGS
jgi:hypothetical protein